MIDVILKQGRDRSVRRRHPWVLSGSVADVRGEASPGADVRVLSQGGETLGYGHYSPESSIRVRMLAFGKEEPGSQWLAERIARSVAEREGNPLLAGTNAVRLVNSEGDGLPGLVADRYDDVVVAKLTSAGMHANREIVADALRSASGAAVGFERADPASARREGIAAREGLLWGDSAPDAPVSIREADCNFQVNVVHGQKTGFYLDQRDGRVLAARLAVGRDVLDLFSYTGGFATACARAGASSVVLVDSSAEALEQAKAQLAANAPDCRAEFERADAFRWLREGEAEFDLLIVDPPPLARRRGDVNKATRAYKDLLLHALRRARPGAFVLSFACSHHVSPDLFRKVAFGASIDAARSLQVLGELGAPSDHPVSLDHPEGHYLSGLLLRVAS
jgi:23S rRNA (cytosine1962-C5)-methyltransferase